MSTSAWIGRLGRVSPAWMMVLRLMTVSAREPGASRCLLRAMVEEEAGLGNTAEAGNVLQTRADLSDIPAEERPLNSSLSPGCPRAGPQGVFDDPAGERSDREPNLSSWPGRERRQGVDL